MVLIDSHELAFQPNAVYDILTMDKEDTEITATADVYESKTSVKEGIFFYRKPGPVALQVNLKCNIILHIS